MIVLVTEVTEGIAIANGVRAEFAPLAVPLSRLRWWFSDNTLIRKCSISSIWREGVLLGPAYGRLHVPV